MWDITEKCRFVPCARAPSRPVCRKSARIRGQRQRRAPAARRPNRRKPWEEIAGGGGWWPDGDGALSEKITFFADGKSFKSIICRDAFAQAGKVVESSFDGAGAGAGKGTGFRSQSGGAA